MAAARRSQQPLLLVTPAWSAQRNPLSLNFCVVRGSALAGRVEAAHVVAGVFDVAWFTEENRALARGCVAAMVVDAHTPADEQTWPAS